MNSKTVSYFYPTPLISSLHWVKQITDRKIKTWQAICRKDSLLLRPLRIDNCQGDPRSPLLTRTNLSMLTVQGIFQWMTWFFCIKWVKVIRISHLSFNLYIYRLTHEKKWLNYYVIISFFQNSNFIFIHIHTTEHITRHYTGCFTYKT